jgi:hypothetical protein
VKPESTYRGSPGRRLTGTGATGGCCGAGTIIPGAGTPAGETGTAPGVAGFAPGGVAGFTPGVAGTAWAGGGTNPGATAPGGRGGASS